jgi:AraC-like DNA-binding protein
MFKPPAPPSAVEADLKISVYQVMRSPYRTLRANIEHPHWAVSHVRQGNIVTSAAGESFDAPRGTVMIHPPRLPYTEFGHGPGEHDWFVFEAQTGTGLDLFRLHPIAPVVRLSDEKDFTRTFEVLLKAWHRPESAARDLTLSAVALQLLAMLLDDWQTSGATPRPKAMMNSHDRFMGLIVWMGRHSHERVGRADIARQAHLQPNYLDRAFRKAYGRAPMEMMREMRMQRARHLLATTDETAGAIARKCGFEDGSYFTRVFRAAYHQTPMQYRAGVKSAKERYARPL